MIHTLEKLVRPLDTDQTFVAIDTFHDMPENTIEVIGYGSSHIWTGMSTMEMYEAYGIGAYNYGCTWQHINTTELFFKDSLRTQSPKVVIIETFLVNDLLIDTDLDGEIYYTRAIPWFEGKREYLKQCFGNDKERYLSYYIPFMQFHENWINLSEGSFKESISFRDFYKTMGFISRDVVVPIEIGDPATFKQEELSEESLAVLDEIVSICKENDIDIIFYTAPYVGTYAYGDAMTQYAEENGCIYFNLFEQMDEVGLDCDTDFFDAGHLNDSGSKKVADYLGEYIVNHYDVTDMRLLENNIWEQNAQRE